MEKGFALAINNDTKPMVEQKIGRFMVKPEQYQATIEKLVATNPGIQIWHTVETVVPIQQPKAGGIMVKGQTEVILMHAAVIYFTVPKV